MSQLFDFKVTFALFYQIEHLVGHFAVVAKEIVFQFEIWVGVLVQLQRPCASYYSLFAESRHGKLQNRKRFPVKEVWLFHSNCLIFVIFNYHVQGIFVGQILLCQNGNQLPENLHKLRFLLF